MRFFTVAASAALVAGAAAHGGVLEYTFGGKWHFGFHPYNTPTGQSTIQRQWSTYNPIQDPTSPLLACNDPGTASSIDATVPAGTQVVAYWNQVWPHNIGPMITWMTECNGPCSSFKAETGEWFKIDQAGLLSGTIGKGEWGSAKMIAQNSSWTSVIPASLKPGNYLIRHETLALHSPGQPQWYPNCAQLAITGSGTASPGASFRAKIPGVYSMSNPSVSIDVYDNNVADQTTYNIPGPAVWTGGASAAAPPAPEPHPVTEAPAPSKAAPAPTAVQSAPSGDDDGSDDCDEL